MKDRLIAAYRAAYHEYVRATDTETAFQKYNLAERVAMILDRRYGVDASMCL